MTVVIHGDYKMYVKDSMCDGLLPTHQLQEIVQHPVSSHSLARDGGRTQEVFEL